MVEFLHKDRTAFLGITWRVEKETDQARWEQALGAFPTRYLEDGAARDKNVALLADPNLGKFSYVTLLREPHLFMAVEVEVGLVKSSKRIDLTSISNKALRVLRFFGPQQ